MDIIFIAGALLVILIFLVLLFVLPYLLRIAIVIFIVLLILIFLFGVPYQEIITFVQDKLVSLF